MNMGTGIFSSNVSTGFIVLLIIVNTFFSNLLLAQEVGEKLGRDSSASSELSIDVTRARGRPRNPVAISRVPEFVLNKCRKESISICIPGGKGDSYVVNVKPAENQESFFAVDQLGESHSYSVNVTGNQTVSDKENKNNGRNARIELMGNQCGTKSMPKITVDYENNTCEYVNRRLQGGLQVQVIAE
jgi:hypothetical protein